MSRIVRARGSAGGEVFIKDIGAEQIAAWEDVGEGERAGFIRVGGLGRGAKAFGGTVGIDAHQLDAQVGSFFPAREPQRTGYQVDVGRRAGLGEHRDLVLLN